MGDDVAWSSSAFLESYERDAALAWTRSETIDDRGRLPRAVLRDIWSWNFSRYERQALFDDADEAVFVPKLTFHSPARGVIRTIFAWPNGIGIAVPPRADDVMLVKLMPDERGGHTRFQQRFDVNTLRTSWAGQGEERPLHDASGPTFTAFLAGQSPAHVVELTEGLLTDAPFEAVPFDELIEDESYEAVKRHANA